MNAISTAARLRDTRTAATPMEYGLIGGLISLGALAAFVMFGGYYGVPFNRLNEIYSSSGASKTCIEAPATPGCTVTK
jgi:Flp pilus assembly pilin Flp